MAAMGLGGSWGKRTEMDINRSVAQASLPMAIAARLHKEMSSNDVLTIPDDQWNTISRGGLATRDDVYDYMRAQENYNPQGTSAS